MQKKIKLSAIFLASFFALGISGCDIPRPEGVGLCFQNFASLYVQCYDLKNDFDGKLRLKTSAKAKTTKYPDLNAMIFGYSVTDVKGKVTFIPGVDKNTTMTPLSTVRLLNFVRELIN